MTRWIGIARLGSIGDDLIVSSVLPLLKRQGYMIEVMAQMPAAVVFENNPYIDKLTILRGEDMPSNNADWQQYFVKRAREYEKFYHLSHSIESHVAFHPDSTWFWWPESYRRQIANKSYLALTHDICEVPHEFAPNFFPTEEEQAGAARTKEQVAPLGQKVIGWVLSGSRIDKLYPYSALAIGRMITELGAVVLLFGGATEKDLDIAKVVQEHVRLQNGSLDGLHAAMTTEAGEWPLRRALSTLQICDLVISPDTGPAWAVASRPMPKMILLGHASAFNITYGWRNTTTFEPDHNRVPCHPCHRLHNDATTCVANKQGNGAACISDTTVEVLVRKARELLRHEDSRVSRVLRAVPADAEAAGGDDRRRRIAHNGDQPGGSPQQGGNTGRRIRPRRDVRRSVGRGAKRGNGALGDDSLAVELPAGQ